MSTETVPDHWDVQQIAVMSSTATSCWAINLLAAVTIAVHQSSGSCSAPPLGSKISWFGSNSLPTTSPPDETRATLGPEVPRSTARMYFCSSVRAVSLRVGIGQQLLLYKSGNPLIDRTAVCAESVGYLLLVKNAVSYQDRCRLSPARVIFTVIDPEMIVAGLQLPDQGFFIGCIFL